MDSPEEKVPADQTTLGDGGRTGENEDPPKAVFKATLTEEEIFQGLTRADERSRGKRRPWVQTGILSVVGLGGIITFFMKGMTDLGSLGMAAVCGVLVAAVWLVLPLQRRSLARRMAETGLTVTVSLFEDGLSFGSETKERFSFGRFSAGVYEDMVICELPGYQLIILPRRAAEDPGDWELLTTHLV